MKGIFIFFLISASGFSQPIANSWLLNQGGETASYWENTATQMQTPTFVFHTTSVLADIISVCSTSQYVFTNSEGMTENMGKYMNPGICIAQGYVFKFPKNPTVPTTKTTSPKEGPIGLLLNGIPVYGLSNANSWNGSSNSNNGQKIWNVEVYRSEGFVLDTAFAAHPQQQGAYHSHATPWRLFKNSPPSVHSPLVGFAFDGFPIYGPYGYSDPNDAASAIIRMKSGYSLRNITVRHTLANGTVLAAAQYGPNISATYPIGTYCEDYEWLADNGGDLDQYNGRFCKTPEYPNGTYAYFVTMNAVSTPEFPYYVGIQYFGAPVMADITPNATITIPTDADCDSALQVQNPIVEYIAVYPNPSSGNFNLKLPTMSGQTKIEIFNINGQLLYTDEILTNDVAIDLSEKNYSGILLLKISNNGKEFNTKIILKQ